jgi:hypothetical protein
MKRKTALTILILTSIIFTVIPESFASPQYLTNLTEVYGDGSCNTCHVMQQGGGQRNFNGTMPTNGTFGNRTSNRMLPLNSYGTLFENQPEHANDPNTALMAIGQPSADTTTPDESTLPATENKAAPGFDFVIFVFGLSAGILLARRHDK